MCRGDAHGDFDRRMIPASSMPFNSCCASRCRSGTNRRAVAVMGRPVISMLCVMLWSGCCHFAALSPMMVGNRDSSFRTGGGAGRRAAAKGEEHGLGNGFPTGCMVAATRTCRVAGSTSRQCLVRKSKPMIGLSTPANTNIKSKCISQTLNILVLFPRQGWACRPLRLGLGRSLGCCCDTKNSCRCCHPSSI